MRSCRQRSNDNRWKIWASPMTAHTIVISNTAMTGLPMPSIMPMAAAGVVHADAGLLFAKIGAQDIALNSMAVASCDPGTRLHPCCGTRGKRLRSKHPSSIRMSTWMAHRPWTLHPPPGMEALFHTPFPQPSLSGHRPYSGIGKETRVSNKLFPYSVYWAN